MQNYNTNTSSLESKHGKIVFTEYIPKTEKAPCVIMSHGFNSCADELTDVAEKLAENGIYAICYDFNGGGTRCKSSGKTTDMSVLTEQDDLRDMVSYALAQSRTDGLYLYGESQGGFVSAITAPELESVKGLFLVYPAFVIPHDWLGKTEDEIAGEFEFMGVKLTRTYYDGVPRYDVTAKAAEFKKPIKIWHGGADPVVDPEYSLKLVKAAEKCELTVFSGLGHWFPPEIRKRVAAEIVERVME